MIILIDQGNSRVKVAVADENQVFDILVFEDFHKSSFIEKLKAIIQKHQIKNGIISSVVKDIPYQTFLESKINLIEINTDLPLPIKISYDTPKTLGKDRIALVCGAQALFPGTNILVIDSGTCITYDFLDKNNTYHGGSISPGINMRLKALNTFTSNLPLIQPDKSPKLIGSSTGQSILSGVINGTIAEIDGIIDQYKIRFPEVKVVVTGGDMFYFDKYLKNNIFASANLVLTGLRNILTYNEKNR